MLIAIDPPSGGNDSIQKPDSDFLLVVCWHQLPISYRFLVVLVTSILAAKEAPSNGENNYVWKSDPGFL